MAGARVATTIGVLMPSDPRAPHSALIREGLALHRSGADIVDIDALDVGVRRGPFAGADDDTIALLIAGLVAVDVPVSITTDRPDIAGLAVEHGAKWVIDPSGGAVVRLDPRVHDSTCRLVIGPWGHHAGPSSPAHVDRYAELLLRHAARLLDAGISSERIAVDAGAGLSADDMERWRLLDALERIVALGYPVLVPATDDLLAEMVADESGAQRLDDAAVAIAVLATGLAAWAVRTHRVTTVAGLLRRMRAPATARET